MSELNASTGPRTRGPARRAGLLGAALLLVAALGFAALGSWQLQRLAWKQDLIARITQRLAAAPEAAPGLADWAAAAPASQEYRRVRLSGEFDHAHEALVGASTVLGSGYWLMTPLRSADGRWTWINRGFVPRSDTPRQQPAGLQQVEGLLRLAEPGGSLLQRNDPQAQRWYSRDVQALSAQAGLPAGSVQPYFIDVWPEPPGANFAATVASGNGEAIATLPEVWPHPGLTVLRFSNNHRSYALTWFALAAMALAASVFLFRLQGRKSRGG